ncbi:MAG: ABC transporter ATP-binding protein [Planctomycetota bacterium]|jgi:ABC-2 type transport system ATP-binding protein
MLLNDIVIETHNLSKEYRDFWGKRKVLALDDLNLEVQRGEVFGYLGPNGSGKTTSVKLLLGLLFPTRGWAKVLGRPPGSVEANQRIGFLPEESYLYRFLNAEETLDFYGRLFKIPVRERRRRIDRLIDLVGLDHARKRQLKEYSKGMARRIGLAQALINDPEVIFLDEPTTGLDPIGTREMKDLIVSLRDQGKTVFMCSHLLADVEDVCDRIAILFQGKLEVIGKVSELLTEEGVVSFRAENVSPATRDKVREVLQSEGSYVGTEKVSRSLEDLFLKVVRERSAANAGQGAVEAESAAVAAGDDAGPEAPTSGETDS